MCGLARTLFAGLFAAAGSGEARASNQPFGSPPAAWVGRVENTLGITLGDITGDGRLDLVLGNLTGTSTVYPGGGSLFADEPAWAGREEKTTSVAVADVDGDGWLDLVRGNRGLGTTLYLNTRGALAATPAWTGPSEFTNSVALADVDGDGDLDLLEGTDQGARLCLNIGGTFAAVPAWSGPAETVESVVLADIDGNGTLDLVCGTSHGAALYLNTGAGYDPVAAWRGPDVNVPGVVLGDVDGDGRLDLVCGTDHGAVLHLNAGARFDSTTAWRGPDEGTSGVTLGDVDGDGDLDLVCGTGQGATLYLAAGGRFAAIPDWRGPDEGISSLALGDIDGDGDLDIVYGVYAQPAKVYLNESPAFASNAAWTAPAAHTTSVALADVDGVGSLDLVRGNAAAPADLYLNAGGTFGVAPAWTGPAENTYAVALGDVDGDGRPDLVRGNFSSQGATLYLNTRGTFGAAPAWTGPAENTRAVILGDVDGDRRPDLVRGNAGEPAGLYLNTGDTFGVAPAWTGPAENTYAVALGDVDGDGRPDLVRGNFDGPTTLYLNVGDRFDSTPAWRGPAEITNSVALGDIDGDGSLDLVRGNSLPDRSTLYLNRGGRLDSVAVWAGPAEDTRSVALADVDGDGRLDLVRGNIDGSTLYMNRGGTFALTPAWSGPAEGTRSVALGDVNADGFPDLVCGNDSPGQATTLYLHRSPWVVDTTGRALRNHLPNNAAYLRSVRADTAGPNQNRLSFEAFDAESDPLWLVGKYQLEGSPVWYPMEFAGPTFRAGPFTTSFGGVPHDVVWNVTDLPFDRREVVVRLRVLSPPRRSGTIQSDPSYLLRAGRIRPLRPALVATPERLVFLTHTVGDTAVDTLRISNPGTQDLAIDRIEVTDPAVVVRPQTSLGVPPGGNLFIEVEFTPRLHRADYGSVLVHSSDPLNPVADIPLVTDVRSLDVETRLVATDVTLALGEAATVIVTPAAQVHFQRGRLHYRNRIPGEAFAETSLVMQGSQWVALIPGDRVGETGIEYYVTVENGGVVTTDPPGAPAAPFFQQVAAPVRIASAAQEDVSGDFPAARPTLVVVSLPAGSRLVGGALHFRPAGAASYESVSLGNVEVTQGRFSPSAVIPASAVGPRGAQYWVGVTTLTRTLTDPAQDPAGQPRLVRTTVASLREDSTHNGGRYRMVSVPLELGPSASSLVDLLSNQPEFGAYDPTRWRSFRWLPANSSYLEISPANIATGALRPEPGRAFWLVARDANRIDTAPVTGHSTAMSESALGPFAVTLAHGWNQVGNPYDFAVAWSGVTRSDTSGAAVALEPPVAWDEAAGSYDTTDVSVLLPFEGYWIWNPAPGPVTLRIPPVETTTVPARSAASVITRAPADSLSWQLHVVVTCGGVSDVRNYAGVHALAAAGEDAFDRSDPPLAPGPAISLYFIDTDHPGHRRTVDFRPPVSPSGGGGAQGQRWVFDVARSGEGVEPNEAQLAFSGLDRVPAGLEVRLIDHVLERCIDLRAHPAYAYLAGRGGSSAGSAEARFELIVGTVAFVEAARSELMGRPRVTRLLPVFPNPVSTVGTLRFETATAGSVTLGVFDLSGRRVRWLVDGTLEAGLHELAWRGEDERGAVVAPGVYLVRLATPDRTEVRKLIRLR